MKVNELMIGDWVHVEAHRGFKAQNVKVETIPNNDSDNEYGHHYGHIGTWLEGGDNDFRDVEAKHLQPILITKTILKKNGFEDYDSFATLDTEKYKVIYAYDGFITIIDNDNQRKVSYIECDNVHVLQHALRLCGIEKEIEI